MSPRSPSRHDGALVAVAPALVTFHVAADAKRLAASQMGTLERLLARVRMGVDPETRRAGEGLVAGLADVAVLGLREGSGRRGGDVVVVLPWVGARRRGERDLHGH